MKRQTSVALYLVHWTPSHWAQVRCPGWKFVSSFFLLHLSHQKTILILHQSLGVIIFNSNDVIAHFIKLEITTYENNSVNGRYVRMGYWGKIIQ